MADKDKKKKRRKPSQRSSSKERRSVSKRPLIIAACIIVFCVVLLYPVGRDYYQTLRTEQRLQAQLDAVNARNEAVRAENDALQTDEGIENQARADLGWTREGEQSAIVTNGEGTADNVSKLPEHLDISSITAPQTWYYSILDAMFFVHE